MKMIGRCDSGHIHPANSEDHDSLRALDAVTPADDIMKVPARYFLPQEALLQELENCKMLSKVRFACPATANEYTNNMIDERFRLLEEKIFRFEKAIAPSVVEDVVISLKSKIERLEANMKEMDAETDRDWGEFVKFRRTMRSDVELIEKSVRDVKSDIYDYRTKSELCAVIDNRVKSYVNDVEKKFEQQLAEVMKGVRYAISILEEDNSPIKRMETKVSQLIDMCEESEKKMSELEEKMSKIERTDGSIEPNECEKEQTDVRIAQLENKMEKLDLFDKLIERNECERERTDVRIAQLENKMEKLDRFESFSVRVANLESGIEQLIEDAFVTKLEKDGVDKMAMQQLEAKIRKLEENVPIAPNSLDMPCWLGNCIVDLERRIVNVENRVTGRHRFTRFPECADYICGESDWSELQWKPYVAALEKDKLWLKIAPVEIR